MDYKAGMFVYAIAFLLGVILVQQLAVLPETSTLFLLSGFASLCLAFYAYLYKKNRYILSSEITLTFSFILLIILGIIYTSYYSSQQLSSRLNEDLIAQNIVISGTVSSIPVTDNEVQRFEFSVESRSVLTAETISAVTKEFPKKIRLSWYYGKSVV